MKRGVIVLLMAILAWPLWAVEPDEILEDPQLEQRARALSQGLRCLVCQNESIDESDAPLARDLRILVRERLVAGDSDEAAIDDIVDRYGEFVLLRPRVGGANLILWLSGPLLGFGALGMAIFYLRSRREEKHDDIALTDEEKQQIDEILNR